MSVPGPESVEPQGPSQEAAAANPAAAEWAAAMAPEGSVTPPDAAGAGTNEVPIIIEGAQQPDAAQPLETPASSEPPTDGSPAPIDIDRIPWRPPAREQVLRLLGGAPLSAATAESGEPASAGASPTHDDDNPEPGVGTASAGPTPAQPALEGQREHHTSRPDNFSSYATAPTAHAAPPPTSTVRPSGPTVTRIFHEPGREEWLAMQPTTGAYGRVPPRPTPRYGKESPLYEPPSEQLPPPVQAPSTRTYSEDAARGLLKKMFPKDADNYDPLKNFHDNTRRAKMADGSHPPTRRPSEDPGRRHEVGGAPTNNPMSARENREAIKINKMYERFQECKAEIIRIEYAYGQNISDPAEVKDRIGTGRYTDAQKRALTDASERVRALHGKQWEIVVGLMKKANLSREERAEMFETLIDFGAPFLPAGSSS